MDAATASHCQLLIVRLGKIPVRAADAVRLVGEVGTESMHSPRVDGQLGFSGDGEVGEHAANQA